MSITGNFITNMFKQIGPNEAASSEGYRVKRSGRFELQYIEEERKVSVEVEPGDGLAIYTSSIKHWEMNDGSGTAVSSEESAEIVERISEALNFLNTKYIID